MDGDTIFVFSRLKADGSPQYTEKQLFRVITAARIVDKYNGINSVYRVTTMGAIQSGDLKLNDKTDLVYAVGSLYKGNGAVTSRYFGSFGKGYLNGDVNGPFFFFGSKETEALINIGIAISHEATVHGNTMLISNILDKQWLTGRHTNGEHGEKGNLSDGTGVPNESDVITPMFRGAITRSALQKLSPTYDYSKQKVKMANVVYNYQSLLSGSGIARPTSGNTQFDYDNPENNMPGANLINEALKIMREHYEIETVRKDRDNGKK